MSTIRRSISTKVPDIGRSDQRMSALTWNSATTPLPRCSPVTSGVPSSSDAQLLVASAASGSASTWRLTVTSFGTGKARRTDRRRRRRRDAAAFPRSGCRRGCGRRGAASPARDRRRPAPGAGPAKRTSTPPCSIQALSRSRISGDSVPTSASTIIGSFWSRNCVIACCGAPRSPSRTSANGASARVR